MQALKRIQALRTVLLLVSILTLAPAVLNSSQSYTMLLVGTACLALRYGLGNLKKMFFQSSKPPGTGWRSVATANTL